MQVSLVLFRTFVKVDEASSIDHRVEDGEENGVVETCYVIVT